MSEIPTDAKILMNEFLEQQRRQEEARAQEKRNRFSKKDSYDPFNVSMSSRDVQRYARVNGLDVVTGRGRHGVHIVAPDGREWPVPDHGGRDLKRGTQGSIVSFIQQNRATR